MNDNPALNFAVVLLLLVFQLFFGFFLLAFCFLNAVPDTQGHDDRSLYVARESIRMAHHSR
jgi:hypothetical protein